MKTVIIRLCAIVTATFLGFHAEAATTHSIIFDGSSITSGGSSLPPNKNYPSQLLGILGTNWSGVLLAKSGHDGAAMVSSFNSRVATQFNSSIPAANQALVFDLGVVDLTSGASVDTVKSRIDQYFSLGAAAGWQTNRIFFLPIQPSYFAGNFNTTNRAQVNNYVAQKYPASAILPEWEPRLYATGANQNTNFFSDLTFPNTNGCALQASVVLRKMRGQGLLPPDGSAPELAVSIYPGVSITGNVGTTYRIEYSTLENPTNWISIGQVTLTKTPQVWFDESGLGQPKRFYRAAALP